MINKEVILIIGLPGSGKSTLAEKMKNDKTEIISSKKLISELSQYEKKFYEENFINKGIAIPDDIYCGWIIKKIIETNKEVFIVDGFPYNINQIIISNNLFKKNNIIIKEVIYLNISIEDALERISKRKVCEKCNLTFPDNTLYCKRCNHKTSVRKDDDKHIALSRINNNLKMLKDIIDYYSNNEKIIEIKSILPKQNIKIKAKKKPYAH